MESKIFGNKINNADVINSEKFSKKKNQECQVKIDFDASNASNLFVCNRLITESSCEAEIQTDIISVFCIGFCENQDEVFKNQLANKSYCTTCDQCCDYFKGYDSLTDDKQFLSMTGFTKAMFNFNLKYVDKCSEFKISTENRLLIFLMKLKLGLNDTALGLLFGVDKITIATIFDELLVRFYYTFKQLLLWPDKDIILKSTPKCFKPDFENVRVIIDCLEFRMEIPSKPDIRACFYSDYEKGFTSKVLLGFTTFGFISFISDSCGGNASDYNLLKNSGLLEKLEDDDEVLADKGFSEFQKAIDESGKRIILVKPPFLENEDDEELSECEVEVSKVRIHIEKIMNRIRSYQILNQLPENLFHRIDMIINTCAILINLQPTILEEEDDDKECDD